jgi:hypothetical protein
LVRSASWGRLLYVERDDQPAVRADTGARKKAFLFDVPTSRESLIYVLLRDRHMADGNITKDAMYGASRRTISSRC